MDPRLESFVKNLFRGLVAGDGDVFSRMASSHENASPAYPEPLAGIVSAILRTAATCIFYSRTII